MGLVGRNGRPQASSAQACCAHLHHYLPGAPPGSNIGPTPLGPRRQPTAQAPPRPPANKPQTAYTNANNESRINRQPRKMRLALVPESIQRRAEQLGHLALLGGG